MQSSELILTNANNGLIPHDHPFFKDQNEQDRRMANEARVAAVRRFGNFTRHQAPVRLDPAHLELEGA